MSCDSVFVPAVIKRKLKDLNELVEQNPSYIGVTDAARFLGMNAQGLRKNIEMGHCPFGLAWQKNGSGNKAYKIPTVTFYFWYTAGKIQQ